MGGNRQPRCLPPFVLSPAVRITGPEEPLGPDLAASAEARGSGGHGAATAWRLASLGTAVPGASLPHSGRLCQHGSLEGPQGACKYTLPRATECPQTASGDGLSPVTAPLCEMGTDHLKPLTLTLRTMDFYRDAGVSSPRCAGKAPPPSRGHHVPSPALQGACGLLSVSSAPKLGSSRHCHLPSCHHCVQAACPPPRSELVTRGVAVRSPTFHDPSWTCHVPLPKPAPCRAI